MKLEPIIQSEVSQKDKGHYSILMHIYGILKKNDFHVLTVDRTTLLTASFVSFKVNDVFMASLSGP